MRDERLERLARMLLTQSLDLRRGEIFEINSGVAANPLNKALLRAAHAGDPPTRSATATRPVRDSSGWAPRK